MDDEAQTGERLWWTLQSIDEAARVEGYFSYLELFPLGTHNRRAAEAIEARAAACSDDEERARLVDRLRAVREPYLPLLEPDSMD